MIYGIPLMIAHTRVARQPRPVNSQPSKVPRDGILLIRFHKILEFFLSRTPPQFSSVGFESDIREMPTRANDWPGYGVIYLRACFIEK